MDIKRFCKDFWHFIWEEDSLLSWLVNIILAFVIVKFLIYPGLGLLLGTSYPVVAVVSGSMEHNGFGFNEWWDMNKEVYKDFDISKEDFSNFKFENGFNKGDLMVLVSTKNIRRGDVIVFRGEGDEPIIHRLVVYEHINGTLFIQTKGDNNRYSRGDEIDIPKENLLGKAKFRIPYLGWFKLGFLHLLGKA